MLHLVIFGYDAIEQVLDCVCVPQCPRTIEQVLDVFVCPSVPAGGPKPSVTERAVVALDSFPSLALRVAMVGKQGI